MMDQMLGLGLWPKGVPRLDPERIKDEREIDEDTLTTLRTGGLFVFSEEDVPPREKFEEPDELPPLPFPRIWIEIDDFTEPGARLFRDLDGRMSFILGWGIVEEEQSRNWKMQVVLIDQENLRRQLEANKAGLGLISEASVMVRECFLVWDPDQGRIGLGLNEDDLALLEGMEKEARQRLMHFSFLPEYLVQLVHVLGARIDQPPVPRPDRRRFERRFGASHPTVYRINLRGTGESAKSGMGSREFHHRWLVRGHYRRSEAGVHRIPGRGLCTWVRPHVKGPVGAPWKGRAVYTTGGET